jgi:imidazolonepropionase-like amidohydrolase
VDADDDEDAMNHGAPRVGTVSAGLVVLALIAGAGCGSSQRTAAPEGGGATETGEPTLVITHVAVIDPRDGRVQTDRTVVIRGERIVGVRETAGDTASMSGAAKATTASRSGVPKTTTASRSSAAPARDGEAAKASEVDKGAANASGGTRVVDGTGKFLIPGLWDMHVHTFFGTWVPGGEEVTLPLFVAFGVTGVRDMGSELEAIVRARAAIAERRLLGPRMVIAGPMLDGPKTQFPASMAIATAEDGRRAVEMLAAKGVDFIKIQSYVPREAYFAIAEECRRRGMTFVGHVPDGVRGAEAAKAGQKSFEHLIGVFEGSSTAEEALVGAGGTEPAALGGAKGPARFLDTYDPAREAALGRVLIAQQTWQCPTLYWERGQWLVDAIDVSRDPDGQYAPASWREKTWPRFTASIRKELDTDPLAVRERFVTHELEIVRRLHDSGVPFLAGTDTPAGVAVIPGTSLHHELQRFVDAGLSPLAALQTATINPARFLGRLADLGTVETGKLADVVLLDANPLVDIGHTRRIAAVIVAGRYLGREELDGILRDVTAAARIDAHR